MMWMETATEMDPLVVALMIVWMSLLSMRCSRGTSLTNLHGGCDRVDETCKALGMVGVEPLSYLNAIRLHILINVLPNQPQPLAKTLMRGIRSARLIPLAAGFA